MTVNNFERSVYKHIKEQYANIKGYDLFYNNLVNNASSNIWLYCASSEFGGERGNDTVFYLEVVTKVTDFDFCDYILDVVEDLRKFFIKSIRVYDFSVSPEVSTSDVILIENDKWQCYDRVIKLETDIDESLIRACHITLRMKLLTDFCKR